MTNTNWIESMTGLNRKGACLALATVALLCFAAPASWAGQGATGSIGGTISDESGGVMPGVTVSASGNEAVRFGVSDTEGRYEIGDLATGRYEVEALLPGFLADTISVSVTGGGTAAANLTLVIAPRAETVTVTRTDQTLSVVPNSIAVVERDQIEFAQRRTSLDESLRGIPGVFVQNRRNYGLSGGIGVSIRAPQPRFGLRGIAIIQDGIPITTADGTTEPGNVDLGSVGRIEVIRGPSSVLYGNSAGGVINLTTTFDRSRKLTIRPDVQFGSYGYNRQQIRADGGNGKTQFMFSASRFETDGFRANSHAEIIQTNLIVRRELGSNTELRGVFNFNDTPYAESASFLTEAEARGEPLRDDNGVCLSGACLARGVALSRNWGEAARQGQGGLTLEHRLSETDRLRVTGWGMWRDLDAVGAFRNVALGRNGFGFRSEYLGGTQAGTLGLDWAAGFDLSSQNDDRMEFGQVAPVVSGGRATSGALDIDQTEDVLSAGPFAQIGISPNDRVRFSAGVRWDYYDFTAGDRRLEDGDQSGERTMSQVSPSVGVTVAAATGVNLFGNVATAYETPTTVELSQSPSGGGGFNQELGPQDLTSMEFGARGLISPARLRYEATVYVSTVDNALVSFQNASEEVFFRNAGKSSRDGVEFLLEWVPTSNFNTSVAYTYQDFVFEEFTVSGEDFAGNLEPGAPPHRIFFGANYTAPFGLRSGATVRWVDKFAATNDNTVFNWSYAVVDLRFGYDGHWGGVDVRPFLGIDNLLDERYNSSIITNGLGGRFFEPSPDREFYVGLTIGTGVR